MPVTASEAGDRKSPKNLGGNRTLVKFLQEETFAQATAAFLNSPALLKKEAPIAYKAIVGMLQDPTLTAFNTGANADGNNLQGLNERDSRELRQDVRTPAESGSDEGGGLRRDRETSEPSPQEGQASEGLGGAIPDDDGDIDGQGVRSQPDEREGDLTPQLDNADRSELGAVEIDIRQILRKFNDAVKDAYGRNLDEVEQQQVHDALTKDFSLTHAS